MRRRGWIVGFVLFALLGAPVPGQCEEEGGTVGLTIPAVFTASETFDVGSDTYSPVAHDYFEEAPFPFEGTLTRVHFQNIK